ncbi:MAG: hypothetical protein ACXWG1_09475 [Usitatibacter sp.]
MTRISSKRTWFLKRVFPVLWFGVLAIVLAVGLVAGLPRTQMGFIAMPLLMMAVGAFVMKKFIFDLADEVFDCGDALLVRKAGKEERIALSNIINVGMSVATNPPRLTLRLDKPGRFGNEVVFSPETPMRLDPFAKNRIAEDLMVRVDRARVDRARR